MAIEMARNYLIENQGKQFDPACVQAFLSRWDEVVGIAAGETPLQKSGAPLAPDIESAAESRPVEDHSVEAAPTA